MLKFLNLFTMTIVVIFLSGCSNSEGKLRVVSDLENQSVKINGKELGKIRVGYATYILEEGNYTIEIKDLRNNGEWLYSAKGSVQVKNNKVSTLELETIKTETQKRKNRIEREKKEKEVLIKKQQETFRALFSSNKLPKNVFINHDDGTLWYYNKYTKKSKTSADVYCDNLSVEGVGGWRLADQRQVESAYTLLKEKTGSQSNYKDYWVVARIPYSTNFSARNLSSNGVDPRISTYYHGELLFGCVKK